MVEDSVEIKEQIDIPVFQFLMDCTFGWGWLQGPLHVSYIFDEENEVLTHLVSITKV